MPWRSFTVQRSIHAPLYAVFDPRERRHVRVGDTQGEYAPERHDGAEYRALGRDDGRHHWYSKDHQVGASYPANVFVWGEDENRESLPHEDVLAFLRESGLGTRVCMVVLPRGMNRGRLTWWNAWMFTPIEAAPYWHPQGRPVEERLRRVFPHAEVHASGGSWVACDVEWPANGGT